MRSATAGTLGAHEAKELYSVPSPAKKKNKLHDKIRLVMQAVPYYSPVSTRTKIRLNAALLQPVPWAHMKLKVIFCCFRRPKKNKSHGRDRPQPC